VSGHDTPRYVGPAKRDRKNKMTNDEIRERFDRETASCYSQRRPAWLPEFEYAFGLAPELVRPYARPGAEILDIGAGTGNLTRTVLEKISDVNAVLLDFSPNMLAAVDQVLQAFPGRYRTVAGDFATADLGTARYAAVISSFAIHHLRSADQYLALYRKIRAALTSPGIFVCIDVVAGATDELSLRNEDEWRAYLAGQGFPPAEVDRILSNYHVEDSPESVPVHLSLLREAGCSAADVIWKKANFAVYTGIANGYSR
jgi:tRNA (cmo5U34)-methyltransferase